MKSRLLFVFLFVVAGPLAQAQNYRCIQPDSVHYFTNAEGYLRAMRVDSVRASGAGLLYYPFKSPRSVNQFQVDSTGGSWLGSRIRIAPDGNNYFVNYTGDSIRVNTLAGIGDSWMFFRNVLSYEYWASVQTIDFREVVPGKYDSVKTIVLQVRDGNNIVSSYKNQYRILLSKNHGMVEAFDFWNFPYDLAPNGPTAPYDYLRAQVLVNDTSRALFRKVRFENRRYRDLYDWQPGDVTSTYRQSYFSLPSFRRDSVLLRIENAGELYYIVTRTLAQEMPSGPTPLISISTDTVRINRPDSFIFSNTILPEEWHNPHFYYYEAGSGTPCKEGARFGIADNYISANGYLQSFEPCGASYFYRVKRGLEKAIECAYSVPGANHESEMTFSRIGQQPCGNNGLLTIGDLKKKVPLISVYPNPSHGQLQLQTTNNGKITTSLSTIDGRLLLQHTWSGSATLDVSGIAPGLYLLKHASDGAVLAERVVIH